MTLTEQDHQLHARESISSLVAEVRETRAVRRRKALCLTDLMGMYVLLLAMLKR